MIMSDTPQQQQPQDSSQIMPIIGGAIVGFFVSFILSLSLFTGPIFIGIWISAVAYMIHFIITQKLRGFALGVTIGVGIGLLAQGLCIATMFQSGEILR
jgi:hypothetical protein